ncbi:MAG TPA: trigger factor [Candidatus Cloacimonadota bacterium]|nr:trigger factor [Candidatus Cloacimonadota bacterium]HQB40718.1 trigger factor [Candidatus Cloacimonadota bacterium]
MKTEIKKVNSNTCELIATVELEVANKNYQKVFNKVKNRLEIPGFRKGKVPNSYIETHYSQYIKEEYFDSFAEQYYKEAIKDSEAQPITAAEFKEARWDTGQDAIFTFQFHVFPDDFEPIYKDIEVPYKEPVYDFDKQIDNSINQLLESNAEKIPFDENSTVIEGDEITLEFLELDQAPEEFQENNKVVITAKNSENLADITNQVIGKKINDNIEGEFEIDEIATKYKFKVVDAFRKKLPELNDDFAKANDYESVEDMKAKMMEIFKQESDRVVENELNRSIVDAVAKLNPLEIPDAYFINNGRYMLERSYQARVDDIDEDTLLKFGKMFSENQTIFDLVVEKIKKIKELQITDEDKDDYIKDLIKDQNQTLEEYKENFKTFIDSDNFVDQVIHKKVINMIKSTMKIVEPIIEQPVVDEPEGE